MADLLFLLITVAFFAIAVGCVRIFDRISGPDAAQGARGEGGMPDEVAEAPAPTLTVGSAR